MLRPEAVDYALAKFQKELDLQLRAVSGQLDEIGLRKSQIEAELTRLSEAIAQQGPSPTLIKAIASRESELRQLEAKLRDWRTGSVKSTVDEIRTFVISRLQDIRGLLYTNIERARLELSIT